MLSLPALYTFCVNETLVCGVCFEISLMVVPYVGSLVRFHRILVIVGRFEFCIYANDWGVLSTLVRCLVLNLRLRSSKLGL